MKKIIKYVKQNKAQALNTTIWIIAALALMFLSFIIFNSQSDNFQSLVELKD
ncbi:MAG: hypothetical protein HRU03_08165 [Nanoarchaeales archaeon]|nr:hypothetical protein [Nanoarchaeales archaeon]